MKRARTHTHTHTPLQTEYSAVLALWLSQSSVRRFGTHCLIRCVIRPSSLNVLGGPCKRISRSNMSALEVSPFHGIALYKSKFTYLLTHTYTRTEKNAYLWLITLYTHSCFYVAGSTQHPQPVTSTSNTMRVEYSVADAGQPQEGDEDGGFVALFEAVCKYSSSVFKSNQSINQSVY